MADLAVTSRLDLMAPPRQERPPARKYYVVSYDVVDNKRRNRIADALLGFGERVQRSVFECLLDDGQFHDLRRRLDKLVDPKLDSVRYYNLGAVTVASVEVHGLGAPTEVPVAYIV